MKNIVSFALGGSIIFVVGYIRNVGWKDLIDDKKWVNEVSGEIEALNSTLDKIEDREQSVVQIYKDLAEHHSRIEELFNSSPRFRSSLEKDLRLINRELERMKKFEKSVQDLNEGEYEHLQKQMEDRYLFMEEESQEVRKHFEERTPYKLVKQIQKKSNRGFLRIRLIKLLCSLKALKRKIIC